MEKMLTDQKKKNKTIYQIVEKLQFKSESKQLLLMQMKMRYKYD